jgi:class I lanthipeptide synthase
MPDELHKNGTRITPAGFLALRTPLLPFDELLDWGNNLTAHKVSESTDDLETIRHAWRQDVELLRSRLLRIVDRPEVRQALFVASPSLEASIENWKHEPESKKGVQTERALIRYFVRMCGRSTPFGIFSGCSVIRNSGSADGLEIKIMLQGRENYRCSSRLDFDYLFALTRSLRCNPSIGDALRYWPNSSLWKIGDSYHYVESRLSKSGRTHHVVHVYGDRYLEAVLERAKNGATISELVHELRALENEAEISEMEGREFIKEMIDSEVLISTLFPRLTGGAPLDDIIEQLARIGPAAEMTQVLSWTREQMEALDAAELGIKPEQYSRITAVLEKLPVKPDPSRLYQVDMIKPISHGSVPQLVLEELGKGAKILSVFAGRWEHEELRLFRETFTARYETAYVPLLEVLDPDVGIGFGASSQNDGSPLIRDLPVGGSEKQSKISFRDAHALLLRKVLNAVAEQRSEMEIDFPDLMAMESTVDSLPYSFSLTATLEAASTEAMQKGDFRILLKGAAGPSGAIMLGRFCACDAALTNDVRGYLREEASHDSEAVYAEIVYLPEGRIGNVLCRPVLRDYEITYLGRSGASQEFQLPASDLLVTVTGSQIVLFSKRLQRRIIPRMTNAHGYLKPTLPPVYRFLCYLQHQSGVGIPTFTWGPLASLPFLPRLRVGKIIVTCAQWRLEGVDLKSILDQDKASAFVAVQNVRQKLKLPRWIQMQESDHTLPVDLDNPLSVDAFTHVLKRTGQAVLIEMWPAPDRLCVDGPEGRFQHELVVPFMRSANSPVAANGNIHVSSPCAESIDRLQRKLSPGSDWLYVKLYGGVAVLDDVLTKSCPPILETALRSSIISRWFFVRYADPHPHLRLRFNGPSRRLLNELVPLLEAFNERVAQGELWKIQFDTYEREIERYGGYAGLLAAEDIFFADSESILEILPALQSDDGLDNRWRIALLGLDRLLSDMEFNLESKRAIMERLRSSYEREFKVNSLLRKQLGDKFRTHRRAVETVFGQSQPGSVFDLANSTFNRRSVRVRNALAAIKSLPDDTRAQFNMQDQAVNYLHMHVNRLIRSAPRPHELALYDILFRVYDGQYARKKQEPQPTS